MIHVVHALLRHAPPHHRPRVLVILTALSLSLLGLGLGLLL